MYFQENYVKLSVSSFLKT